MDLITITELKNNLLHNIIKDLSDITELSGNKEDGTPVRVPTSIIASKSDITYIEKQVQELYQPKGNYAAQQHTHVITDVDGLESALSQAGKVKDVTVNNTSVLGEDGVANINITGKLDVISDLSTIRTGAAKGATAVLPSAISDMETKTNAASTYQLKGDYATTSDVEAKQDKLTAGTNITIEDNVISATGEGGGGIEDAPSDGTIYGRQNASWVSVKSVSTALDHITYSSDDNAIEIDCNCIAQGDMTAYSDMRKKDVISDKQLSIDSIANSPLFTFTWNDRDDNSVHLGTSAQYWKDVTPELVLGTEDTTYSLNYGSLGVACSISIAREINNLKEENKDLKLRLEQLEKTVELLTNK